MKKYLSILLTFVFVFTPLNLTKAEDTNSDAVTFFESMDNLQQLNGYVINQNLSGSFKVNMAESEDIQDLIGNYDIDLNTRIYNKNPYESDLDSNFKGQIQLSASGKNKPFGNLAVNFIGEMISLYGDGIYIRLIDANLVANGIPDSDKQSYQDFIKEFDSQIKSIRGQWIYLPSAYYTDGLKAEAPEGMGELLDTKALSEKFKKDGIEKTYQGIIQDTLNSLAVDGTITDKEMQSYTKISDEFFNTKFFSYKTLSSGKNSGLTSFYLVKPKITQLVSKIADILGENLSVDDIKQLSSYLEKFNISGLYHIDEANRITDIFRLKFVLRNIDVLNFLQFNYSHKISDLNNVGAINKPAEYTSAEELNLPFLPQPVTDEESYIPETDDASWDESALTEPLDITVGNAPIKGYENAPVVIVEYSDFECPFCAQFNESTLLQIVSEYIDKDKVQLAYKHFPLSFHENSKNASLASECARELGGDEIFYKYHDVLYANQTSLTVENLKKWAADMGLDTYKFNSCLDTQKYAKQVDADFAEGESLGVAGTPTFFINGRMLSGAQPFSAFQTIIDEELAKVQ